ncbi:MAG: hypothetical protein U1E27_01170, partial [Kiritimatiellia bacterium]|nr:hypothetical protein [Kiritimatiellia bacterium]
REGKQVGSIRFSVDDGTGVIGVQAARAQAQKLVDANRVPRAGDRVSLIGSLTVSADSTILRLQAPESLNIERPAVEEKPTALGSLRPQDVGASIFVEARLLSVTAPRPESRAPWRMRLRDDSGEMDAVMFGDAHQELVRPESLAPGARLRGRAKVGEYRGALQLVFGGDIELDIPETPVAPVAEPVAPVESITPSTRTPAVAPTQSAPAPAETVLTPIATVTAEMKGREVCISGQVAEIRAPGEGTRAPWRMEIEEGEARVLVVFWTAVAEAMAGQIPVVGDRVQVTGQVDLYRETLQVAVRKPDGIRKLPPPEAVRPAADPETPTPMGLADLDLTMTGRLVRVKGRLGASRELRAGIAYPLTEGEATIQLILWNRFVPEANRATLREGLRVEATGRVKAYQDHLEIVPASPEAVIALPEEQP